MSNNVPFLLRHNTKTFPMFCN